MNKTRDPRPRVEGCDEHQSPNAPVKGAPRFQPTVYLIVRVPYGGVPWERRGDVVDERLLAFGDQVVAEFPAASRDVLDEHGVAEWIGDAIKAGLVLNAEAAVEAATASDLSRTES